MHICRRNLPDPRSRARRVRAPGDPGYPPLPGQDPGQGLRALHVLQDARRGGPRADPWFAEQNIALFAQSEGMPRTKMVEAFKADVDSVIFGPIASGKGWTCRAKPSRT